MSKTRKVKVNRPYNLKEIAFRIKMSDRGARTWIKNNVPGIYKADQLRKRVFSPKETERILNSYEVDL